MDEKTKELFIAFLKSAMPMLDFATVHITNDSPDSEVILGKMDAVTGDTGDALSKQVQSCAIAHTTVTAEQIRRMWEARQALCNHVGVRWQTVDY